MKWLKGFLGLVIIFLLVAVIAVVVIINPFGASPLNKYTQDGNLPLPGLKEPVTVQRDEKGMAYIYARNMKDLYICNVIQMKILIYNLAIKPGQKRSNIVGETFEVCFTSNV